MKADDLLQAAATVQQQCIALRALSDPLNDRQQNAIEEIIRAIDLFSGRVIDLTDMIENHSDQIGTVSHRLRTPLVTIRGYPEMLLIGMYGTLTDNQQDCVRQLDEAANRLTSMIDTLFKNAGR